MPAPANTPTPSPAAHQSRSHRPRTSDSSHRSGCIRNNRSCRGPYGCRASRSAVSSCTNSRPIAILQHAAPPPPRQTQSPACCETSPPPRPCAPAQTPAPATETQSPPETAPPPRNSAASSAPARSTPQIFPVPPSHSSHAPAASPRSRDPCSRSPPPHRAAHQTQTAATSPPPDSDSPSAPAPAPNTPPAQTKSALPRNSPRCPIFSPVLGEVGIFPAHIHPQNPKRQRRIDRSSASPTHSLPAPQTPSAPAATPPAHRSDQTISPRSTPEVSRAIANPGKCRSIARRNFASYAARAAFFADGDRRSRSRQISSFVGRACPSRCTASRSIPFFTSASSTRRTVFRSADHRCSRHLLCSPEIEYFACARSNATAPSSSTTAPDAPARKSCTRPAQHLRSHARNCSRTRRQMSVTNDHSLSPSMWKPWRDPPLPGGLISRKLQSMKSISRPSRMRTGPACMSGPIRSAEGAALRLLTSVRSVRVAEVSPKPPRQIHREKWMPA